MRKNNSYSPEFKVQVVEDILSKKESLRGSVKKYDIDRSVIRKWIKRYNEEGISYFMTEHRGRHGKNDYKIEFKTVNLK